MNAAEIIRFAANGNEDAHRFLAAYYERAHLLDDIVDGDKPVTDRRLAAAEVTWIAHLAANPFFQTHKASLVPLMIAGISGWLDSNRLPPGAERDHLKAAWHETVWYVAFITGGWDFRCEVTRRCREFDVESQPIQNEAAKE